MAELAPSSHRLPAFLPVGTHAVREELLQILVRGLWCVRHCRHRGERVDALYEAADPLDPRVRIRALTVHFFEIVQVVGKKPGFSSGIRLATQNLRTMRIGESRSRFQHRLLPAAASFLLLPSLLDRAFLIFDRPQLELVQQLRQLLLEGPRLAITP
jgi:hypothetical protein